MKIKFTYWIVACLAVAALAGQAGSSSTIFQADSTWQLLQDNILTPKCAGCHAEGTSFARQSELILTAGAAYDRLVNVPPKNQAALRDGLLRVGTKGLESLEKSFLWEKINAAEEEHFYADHPQYGAMMPLDGFPLTNGEIELIRQWIVAGAPREGAVADPSVLNDTSKHSTAEFRPLEVPENGFQLHVGPFRVPAERDREVYQFIELHNSEPVYVKRFQGAMAPGSHHLVVWSYSGLPAALRPPADRLRDFYDPIDGGLQYNFGVMAYNRMISASQTPFYDYSFPEGVALKLPPNTGLDINSHYARPGSELQGEAYVNLYYADPAEVNYEVTPLWLSNTDIALPPNSRTTLTRDFIFPREMNMLQMWGHGHASLEEFRVEIIGGPRNGELLYYSDDWEHPPILYLNPPLPLQPGQGLRLIATYNNTTDVLKRFGVMSTDEMMMLFGYAIEGPMQVDVKDWRKR